MPGVLFLKLRELHDRITLNRLTATFFLFGFFHCFGQGIIQSLLFSADSTYHSFISDIVAAADVPPANHTYFVGSTLRMCDYLPHNDTNCIDVFTLNQPPRNTSENIITTRSLLVGRESLSDGVKITPSTNEQFPVNLEMKDGSTEQLSDQCIRTLLFPGQDLSNNRREDLAFIFLQFWLFGMSVIAMCYDSVPHLISGIAARVLLTAWSAYSIWRTKHLQYIYDALLRAPGTPCTMDFFPTYFATRSRLEIPDLVLNCTALMIMVWTLLRVYSVQSYKCVGAPARVTRMLKLYLAVQACLHLEMYVLLAGMGLWIDQLLNTYIKHISTNTPIYKGVFIFYLILIVPWTILGWYAVRYEKRKTMFGFLAIGFLFFSAACMMFYSQVFRWTFYMWPNLGCYTVSYMILMVATMVLGFLCLRNFGQGLANYLHAEAALSSSHFSPEVFEHDRDVEKQELPEFPPPLHALKAGGFERPESTYYLPTLHAMEAASGGVVAIKKGKN